MSNIRFHPLSETLQRFASGDLDPASSIMISTHLEYCPHCRQLACSIEDSQAAAVLASETPEVEHAGTQNTIAPLSPDLMTMMHAIMTTSEPDVEPEIESGDDSVSAGMPTALILGDKTYPLPRALQRHRDRIGPWSRLPGKLKRAAVDVGGPQKMNFIYMDSDSALPEHTHQGQEITLVLAGEFYDDQGTYRPGDFIIQTSANQHVPKTRSGQDCLCLTLLDAPLHFTSGLATLLNPFSQLFFRL